MAESARLASRTHDMALSHMLESSADGLWVRMLAGFAKTDGFTVGSGTVGNDADAYGIAVGGDLPIGKVATLGAAYHYADSDIESGDGATTSDMYEWGATLYAGHVFESGLRLSAALVYGNGSSDVNQQNLSAVSADVDADVWTAGMRLAYPMTTARTVITPYVGFDAVRIEQDAFTVKLVGATPLSSNPSMVRTTVCRLAFDLTMLGRSASSARWRPLLTSLWCRSSATRMLSRRCAVSIRTWLTPPA